MKETKEIILLPTGESVLRAVKETPCDIVTDLAGLLCGQVSRLVRCAGIVDGRMVHILACASENFIIQPLEIMPVNMPWRMQDDTLLPSPAPAGCDSPNPLIRMDWRVPYEMSLVFISKVGAMVKVEKKCNFLLAFDPEMRCYRLPLPNIFEDGSICMGDFDSHGTTIIEAHAKCWQQFKSAQWNTDLYSDDRIAKLEALISFKVTKGVDKDEFDQIEVKNWSNHCYTCETRASSAGRAVYQ